MTVTNRLKLGQGTWDSAIREVTFQVNIGNIDRTLNEADVQGTDIAQINAYMVELDNAGFDTVTDLGDVPEPTPPTPETPPTPDEITRDQEVATAYNKCMVDEIARLDALALIEYDLIKTTTEPYLRKFDITHLRQRAR